MTLAIFDVDGVLVDTFDVHQRAYKQLGIDAPEYMFGRSWREWLPNHVGSFDEAERINRKKRTIQREELSRGVKLLAGVDVIKELKLDGWNVALCSHSDLVTLDLIINRCGLAGIYIPRRTVTGGDKAWTMQQLLKEVRGRYEPTVYVDDNNDEGRRICELLGITFVPFINDVEKLYSEIVHATGA